MKKIRCARCGVVNLEGFVTYPNCAGCGAALSTDEPQVSLPFWRRPVGPPIWASVLGGAVLSLILLATRGVERAPENLSRIKMVVKTPRSVRAGAVFMVAFRVDVIGADSRNEETSIRGVRLRLERELFQRFAYVSLHPPPDSISDLGTGRYFDYASLARGARLQLKLRAVRLGRQEFAARILDAHQNRDLYSRKILVRATALEAKP